MLSNADLRKSAKDNGIAFWQIADKLNISEPTMTRKLRRELSAAEKAKILAIIDELSAAKQKETA